MRTHSGTPLPADGTLARVMSVKREALAVRRGVAGEAPAAPEEAGLNCCTITSSTIILRAKKAKAKASMSGQLPYPAGAVRVRVCVCVCTHLKTECLNASAGAAPLRTLRINSVTSEAVLTSTSHKPLTWHAWYKQEVSWCGGNVVTVRPFVPQRPAWGRREASRRRHHPV